MNDITKLIVRYRNLGILIDTNILLEILLSQEHAKEAKHFLDHMPRESLHLSDFSLHSIGLML